MSEVVTVKLKVGEDASIDFAYDNIDDAAISLQDAIKHIFTGFASDGLRRELNIVIQSGVTR